MPLYVHPRALRPSRLDPVMLGVVFAAILFAVIAPPASAIDILYDVAPIGGDVYRVEYTVMNDGSIGAPVAWFQVDFDPALYDEFSLMIDSAPAIPAAGWDEVLLASGIGVPAAYDAFSDTTSIAIGQSLGGFAVEFTWLGGGAGPGVQPFGVLDQGSFEFVEMGTTVPVPSPGTGTLVGAGLLFMALGRQRARLLGRAAKMV